MEEEEGGEEEILVQDIDQARTSSTSNKHHNLHPRDDVRKPRNMQQNTNSNRSRSNGRREKIVETI